MGQLSEANINGTRVIECDHTIADEVKCTLSIAGQEPVMNDGENKRADGR